MNAAVFRTTWDYFDKYAAFRAWLEPRKTAAVRLVALGESSQQLQGSLDRAQHELNYLAQAHWHHFTYRFGEMTGLDRGSDEREGRCDWRGDRRRPLPREHLARRRPP